MLQLLVVASLIYTGIAYPSGAPEDACANYIPQHSQPRQTDPSPYSIDVSADQYSPGGTVTVTLSGTQNDKIKGFLIGAAVHNESNSNRVGSFAAAGDTRGDHVQTRCDGNALTHANSFSEDGIDTVTLTWNAPATTVGSIRFYVTFVKKEDTYWVSVPSTIIWDGQGVRPMEPAVTTFGPVTDGPTISPITTDGCGSTDSCYRSCQNNACDFILKWKAEGDSKVNFELVASNVKAPGYVALGIAPSASMVDVTMIACVVNRQREVNIQTAHAENRRSGVSKLDSILTGVGEEGSYTANGEVVSCRFGYDNSRSGENSKYKDLKTELFAFIARGPSDSGSILKHSSLPKISPGSFSFLKTGVAGGFEDFSGSAVFPLVKAHGCIMILAWVLCASVGIILARYYKPMWENRQACGQKVWFSFHRALMLTCMFLTVIAIILIFIENDGLLNLPEKLPARAHPILGLITLICALLNPIIAAFRCHPGDKNRPIFNWVHWFFGTVGHIFASVSVIIGLQMEKVINPIWLYGVGIAFVIFHLIVEIFLFVLERVNQCKAEERENTQLNNPSADSKVVAVFLGMLQERAFVPWWLTYVMMAFCLFHVLVEFILEIHQCCTYDKNRDRQEAYQMQSKGDPKAPEPKHAGRGFKCVLLVIYVIVVSILTIVMVAITAANGQGGIQL